MVKTNQALIFFFSCFIEKKMISSHLVSVAKTLCSTKDRLWVWLRSYVLHASNWASIAKGLANKLEPELSFFAEFCQILLPLYGAKWKQGFQIQAMFNKRTFQQFLGMGEKLGCFLFWGGGWYFFFLRCVVSDRLCVYNHSVQSKEREMCCFKVT